MYFNPRTHVGCDGVQNLTYIFGVISIHAPTWGATGQQVRQFPGVYDFNPRTHVGCDFPGSR